MHQVSLHSHEGLRTVFFVTCPLARFRNPLGTYSNKVRVKSFGGIKVHGRLAVGIAGLSSITTRV